MDARGRRTVRNSTSPSARHCEKLMKLVIEVLNRYDSRQAEHSLL